MMERLRGCCGFRRFHRLNPIREFGELRFDQLVAQIAKAKSDAAALRLGAASTPTTVGTVFTFLSD